ncbi:MAG TPA: PAS domain S-box protein [Ferruginibacter sp.]|nr:PAS domain S-box protein [Ferruginibacter sp.]
MKDSEFEFSAFFEMTPDLVCIAGKDGFFRKINQSVLNTLGYTEEELYSLPIASFQHPEDQPHTQQTRNELIAGKALLNFVNRYITKSGQVVWLEWTSIYFPDREIVFAIAKDVTARKQIEKQVEEKYIKFKGLASHFKSSIEKDRKYLAYEIQEELAQLVASLKFDVEWIAGNTPALPLPAKSRIENALAISKLLIKTLQRVSFSISPKMMSDFGLNATLVWLCKEFSILNEMPCEFNSSCNEDDMTEEIKTDFFRICQEALTNVIEHAQATSVEVYLEENDDDIRLSIIDNGRGFDIAPQTPGPGFTSMQQRAESINGRLQVQSEAGRGTRVCLILEKSATV